MKYTTHHQKPHLRYIYIEAELDNITEDSIELQLPSWRPGRYELGNFAKNVRNFKVKGTNNEDLTFFKATKDLWKVNTQGHNSIIITYEYYSAVLDAGSTYTCDDMLYINPVNCLVYEVSRLDEPCTLRLNIPENFIVACALKNENGLLYAANYDELADSPLICSSNLEHHTFEVAEATHHVWIHGSNSLDINQLIQAFTSYTKEQLTVFGHFPATDFHYLIHMMQGNFRHGVEHSFSTVIAVGPGNDYHFPERLDDLLALCSHEFFHFWNIKRLRPAIMLPYDYTTENYSVLGYIYEGVTTYYGDYMLLRSGVWSFDKYSEHFSADLQKHFGNSGRYNYSVAESSFDTWLDGYAPGVPGRKVSIYVEGMLSAIIADVMIRNNTNNMHSLDTVMKTMYERFYLNGKGYTEQDFKDILEEICGHDMEGYFEDIIWGKGNIEKLLPVILEQLGLEIETQPALVWYEKNFGCRFLPGEGGLLVAAVLEDSPADKGGLALGDKLMQINGVNIISPSSLLEIQLLPDVNEAELVTQSQLLQKKVVLHGDGESYYPRYKLVKMAKAKDQQKEFYKHWCKQDF